MIKVNGKVVVLDDVSIESVYTGEIEITGNFEFDSIKTLVNSECEIEDIFDKEELEEWAEDNGYVKLGED